MIIKKTVRNLNSWQREIVCHYLCISSESTSTEIQSRAAFITYWQGQSTLDAILQRIELKLRYRLIISDLLSTN